MKYVEYLKWDSEFFGFPIGRVLGEVTSTEIWRASQEADRCEFRCTYLLANTNDHGLIEAAQRAGFVVRDIRVEMDRPIVGHRTTELGLRLGRAEDLPKLQEIAEVSFRGTRFFTDKAFPPERSVDLYVEWVRKGLSSDPLWKAIVTEDLRGFVICTIDGPSAIGTIILIGVAQESVRKGIGTILVSGAGKLFVDNSLLSARVVTQGHNVAAQRLYQGHGYRTTGMRLWLHRWRQ